MWRLADILMCYVKTSILITFCPNLKILLSYTQRRNKDPESNYVELVKYTEFSFGLCNTYFISKYCRQHFCSFDEEKCKIKVSLCIFIQGTVWEDFDAYQSRVTITSLFICNLAYLRKFRVTAKISCWWRTGKMTANFRNSLKAIIVWIYEAHIRSA